VSPPLLAVDGDSLAHRAYHALPQSIRDAEGKPANMIVGFTNMLVTLWEAEQPRGVFVGFDSIGEPTYRHELLPGYQSGRDFPPVLTDQLDRLPPLVEALGFAAGKAVGFEADDFLAAAVRDEEARGGSTLVLTSDRDMCQLASPLTTLLMPRRGVSDIARVGPDEVRERFGVEPAQIPDFIALRGDQSDKIPGAPGVGPARAAAILKKHGTLEASLEAGGFPSLAKELRDYRRIATLDASAPLPPLDDNVPTWVEASTLVRSWGLNQLADRLAARAQA
jgi:5'-3' exonuclease